MCCFFTAMVLLGPRAAIIVWGIIQPTRWSATFDTFIWPLLGFLFLPWTTLMYVGVYPGGITGWDGVWLGLAVFADIASYAGSAYRNRARISSGYSSMTA